MPPGNNYIPHTKPQPLYDWPNSESLHRTIIEIVEENLYLDPSKSGYRRIDEDEAHIIAPSLREILLQAVSTFEISARLAEVLEAETFNVAYAVWNQLPAEQKIRLADETKARLQQDYCRHSRQPPHRQGDYFRQRLLQRS